MFAESTNSQESTAPADDNNLETQTQDDAQPGGQVDPQVSQPDQGQETDQQGQQQPQPVRQQQGNQRHARREGYSELFKSNQQLALQNRQLQEQLSQLAGMQQQFYQRFDQAVPAPPDPHQQRMASAEKKYMSGMARLDKDPQGAMNMMMEAMREQADAIADAKMQKQFSQFEERMRGMIPQEKPPELNQLYGEIPWAQKHEPMIAAAVQSIAATDGRDMRSPQVFWATVREATLKVGRMLGLPLPQQQQQRRAPFAPTGQPVHGGDDGGGAPDLDMERVDAAARVMYPQESDPMKRRAMWMKDCGPMLQRR